MDGYMDIWIVESAEQRHGNLHIILEGDTDKHLRRFFLTYLVILLLFMDKRNVYHG